MVDRAGMLDDGQQQSAVDDALRLQQLGIPVQVWIENTDFDQEQADFRAQEIRLANRIESARDRDDGILVYASVNPRNRDEVTISISVGAKTLPDGGLTLDDIDTIRETIVRPQLEAGHPARAIVYSIREMIYQQNFSEPPGTPLSERREQIRAILDVVGPLAAIALAGWLVVSDRRGRIDWWLVGACAAAAAAVAVFAIVGRSGPAVAGALFLGAIALWRAVRLDDRGRGTRARQVRLTPRAPGSRAARRRTKRAVAQ